MDVRIGLWIKLSAEELMLLNCGEDEVQSVHPKGDQSWVFIGRTDAKAETPSILATSCEELAHWKRLWCWEGLGAGEEGTTEDEMAGWHHWLDGRESEWTPGDGDKQGGLACCDSWGRKEADTTERLNWTELNWTVIKSNFYATFCRLGNWGM